MSAHDVDDQLRAALGKTADVIELPDLLPLGDVASMATRRARRRQVIGGLATVLLVAVVTISAGLVRNDTPNAVFAGQLDQPFVPSVVTADGDRLVGLAVISPFEVDNQGNLAATVVTSADGEQWAPVEGEPVFDINGAQLQVWNDTFHIVGVRSVEVVGLDGATSIGREVVHRTSADLIDWTEAIHPLASEFAEPEFNTVIVDMAFVDAGPIVLLTHNPSFLDIDAAIEARGQDAADMCEFVGEVNRTTIRMCGETEPIEVFHSTSRSFPFSYELVTLHGDALRYIDIPEVDDGRTRSTSQTSLYQTDEGVGVVGRDVFESSDGVEWTKVDVGREPAVLMAANGSERVYRTWAHVQRYGANDPAKGMGYSADGGMTWSEVSVDDLFIGDEFGRRFYGQLTAVPGGWLVVGQRTLEDRPSVDGVEREFGEGSTFTVTVDDYVLEGQTPYGPAELRDPSGQVVRSWKQLELSNPVWSGLDVVRGDLIINEETGSGSITVTSEQWSAVLDPQGPNTSALLFSRDGVEWSILDSAPTWHRILAATADGVLVQRWQPGNYSHIVAHVEWVPFPVAEAD